eukprot:gi/632938642/ref/XP_007905816.1/ PREDICTED: serine beta-lactamase-like protein LACTB, mitochondrial [Callorhinchus milii]
MFSRTSSPGSGTSGQDRCGGGADMTGENVERDFHEGIQEGKEQIKDLNDRFAKYINNTVMSLQRKNKELLGELKRVEREEFGAVEKVFQKDNQDFQCRMDELQNELVLFRLDLDKIKARLDKEIQQKREYEKDFQDLKKKYDDALVLLERLQCQCKLLEAQLAQLKIVRDQERIYWQQKIDNLQNLDQVDTNTLDLEQALRNMRSEYEQLAKRNKEELERYKQKFEESSNPLQRIKKETEDEMAAPGIIVGVSVDGKEVWAEGLGYADVENRVLCKPETVMRIASISKSLSMAAIAKLWEEGKLDLDAPVQKYVPEFPEKEYEGEKVTITTRLLVSHLSGIRHYEKDVNKIKEQKEKRNKLIKVGSSIQDSKDRKSVEGTREKPEGTEKGQSEGGTKSEIKENEGKSLQKKEFEHEEYYMKERFENVTKSLKLFQDDPLVFSPGTQFLYSTHGWTLLSAVVERVAGQNFLEFMKKLFRDIGMLRTVPEEHEPIIYNRSRYYFYNKKGYLINCPYVDNSYKWAGGGFLSTVQDLLKFGNAMLYSYQSKHFQKGDHRHLPGYLKPETIKMLWTPVEKTELAWDKDGTYAMGWGVIEQKQKYGQCRQQHHYLTHTGGAVGASSVLLVLPEDIYTAALPEEAAVPPRGIVVTILCNMQSASLNSTALQIALEFYKVKTNKNHNI